MPALADELYTPDGFAKQIDTYKSLALSASNALRSSLSSDNISLASSVSSVTNTIDWSGSKLRIGYRNGAPNYNWVWSDFVYPSVAGTFSYVVPSGKTVNRIDLELSTVASLPASGKYSFSLDFASDSSLSYSQIGLWMTWSSKNQQSLSSNNSLTFNQSSGDFYASNVINLQSNVSEFVVLISLKDGVSAGGAIGGKFSINFTKSSSTADIVSPGTAPSSDDIQSGIANTTSQIATSVNDVYDSIHDLMQHISNQLAALWDQMYNYMHVPTYNKLQEILLTLQSIAMGSDLQKIADQISNSTTEQTSDLIANEDARTDDLINNANSNQQKTEQAIEKHGNFIIEGLKSLFIPSDDYFSSKFSELNEFFKDRFGFLYTPIDLLIRFVNLIYGASDTFDGIPFPELSWDGHVLLAAQTVRFDILDIAAFKQVQKYLYFLTDVMMIGALVSLIHRKFEEVMQN